MDDPTAANILDAIDTLKQAEETDTVVLFIAGHGINDGPNYRFLATNAERAGGTFRGSTVVPWQILQEAMEAAKGRRILFIDTSHSGNAYYHRLGNAAYHANIITYTAARFDQTSREDDALGHGLFTYAVLEGLEGKGGIAAHHQISTKELADYVIKRVEELAKAQNAEQEPQYFKGRDAEDYVLARGDQPPSRGRTQIGSYSGFPSQIESLASILYFSPPQLPQRNSSPASNTPFLAPGYQSKVSVTTHSTGFS